MWCLLIFNFRFSICAFFFYFPPLKEDRISLLSFSETRKEEMTIDCYGMNFDYLFFFFLSFFFLEGQLGVGGVGQLVLYVDYWNDLY